MLNRLEIQRPKHEQLEEIGNLFEITIKHTFEKESIHDPLFEEITKIVQGLKDTLKRDLDSKGKEEYFLIAILDQQVVGTIAYGPPNSMITENVEGIDSVAPEVKCVYILPSMQGMGVGSFLFEKIKEVLTGQKIDNFYLDSGYKLAQAFWQRKLGTADIILKDFWGLNNSHMIWYRPSNSSAP